MKVILATDGSQFADEASWLLAHLPHSEKLELFVLFISNMPNLHGSSNAAELMERLEVADKEKAASLFAHLKKLFDGANASIELVVSHGHIGTTIVREADSRKVNLIVLGAVGHSLFERMFGSTSDFVATHAKCSVLVVRPTGLKKAKRPIDVCIAYDETHPASVVFGQLAQFGWGTNTKMEVVSVVTLPFAYSEIPLELDLDEINPSGGKSLTQLRTICVRFRPMWRRMLLNQTTSAMDLFSSLKRKVATSSLWAIRAVGF